MNYVLEDYVRAFEQLKRTCNILWSTQSVYYTLLGEADLRHFPTEFEMSIRDLGALAGLKSTETVHTAKNVLKNLGLIDFKPFKRTTVFTLLPPNTKQTSDERLREHETNNRQTPNGGISGDFGMPTHAGTRAISISVSESESLSESLSESSSSSRAREEVEIEEALRKWRELGGEEPTAADIDELRAFLRERGRKWLLYAINTAYVANNNPRKIPVNFLLSITARLLKGSEKLERQKQARTSKPTATDEEDSRGKWIFSD